MPLMTTDCHGNTENNRLKAAVEEIYEYKETYNKTAHGLKVLKHIYDAQP